MKKIGIINYGKAGNIFSIKKALQKAGAEIVIIEDNTEINKVDKLILPGVGNFANAIEELQSKNLLNDLINFKGYLLGICLGMQILAKKGFEGKETKGLGIIEAEVKPIEVHAKVPHMGFNSLNIINPHPLLKGIEKEEFYFMHSYEVVSYTNIVSLSKYYDHQFVSCIAKDNFLGVQFHPEKSRDAGIELFKNFIKL
jgi:imidazole glycerol phosphate synthase glutamine amidotransferase subunit